jgi:predicted polyphosphate/ATP-dependent NAD kinase
LLFLEKTQQLFRIFVKLKKMDSSRLVIQLSEWILMNWEAKSKPENAFIDPYLQHEELFIDSIANDVCENMLNDHYYILNPGKITSRILNKLGLDDNFSAPKVVKNGALVTSDPNNEEQIKYFENENTSIIISPNRKGVLFMDNGISPKILKKLQKENIIIVAPSRDSIIDQILSGYHQVITSYRRRAVYKASPI